MHLITYLKLIACSYGLFFLSSCSELGPNPHQLEKIDQHFECHQELVNSLIQTEDSIIKPIFNKELKTNLNPSNKIPRLVHPNQFEHLLSTEWKNKCSEKLAKENDLKGVRFINKQYIIIEIDDFNRNTLSQRYAKSNTREIHRLIFHKQHYDPALFYLKNEKQIWQQSKATNWTYDVSQIK